MPTNNTPPQLPNFPRSRAECIAASSETANGTYIAGHTFIQLMAFEDESTGRWYMVDMCAQCGTPDVLFTDKFEFIEQAKQYPIVNRIGGLSRE